MDETIETQHEIKAKENIIKVQMHDVQPIICPTTANIDKD